MGAYGVNGLNRYTSIDGAAVSYDTNGNLTADGAGMTYVYDMENHLVSTGGVASTLYYDVLGRLARVSVAGTTTDFHYDGDVLVGEYVGSGLTRCYVHSGGVDEPLVQYQSASVGAGHRRYLHADHQGSIIARTDYTGVVTKIHAYDPYGISRGTNDERFGYTGQTWIKELGLNYYKARFYAPKIGRFLQTDPIFYADGMNLYGYASADPINNIDPDGLSVRDVGVFSDATRLGFQMDMLRRMSEQQFDLPLGDMAHQSAIILMPGYDLGTCMSTRGDCSGGDWILSGIGVIPGGKGAALGAKVIAKLLQTARNARALNRAMRAAGLVKPPGHAAHHIVAGTAEKAKEAQAVLQKFGIDINDAANGVYLPSSVHNGIHTDAYYDAVNAALRSATSRDEAIQILGSIGAGLK